jgi:hypothetical protein
MRIFNLAIRVSGLVLIGAPLIQAAELKPETAAAWDRYLTGAGLRMKTRLNGERPFLWADESPVRVPNLRQGAVLVHHTGQSGSVPVPHGVIHDWMGAIYIPGATMPDVLGVVRDYGQYREYYRPEVVQSKLLSSPGDEHVFNMLWLQKALFVTAALDTEYVSSYYRLNRHRWYSVATSTRIQEIQDYGQPWAKKLPPGEGTGFVWRLYSLARFEERDGGVYMELEALGLSRDVPVSVRWVVEPVVARISREFVANSLRKTRDAVMSVCGDKSGSR